MITLTPIKAPSTLDFDPFGMLLVGRNWELGNNYRYEFNGKESDTETYGESNIYDYGFRIYNPRLGKFLSVDPLMSEYPFYTPYQFAGNLPIWKIDIDGLEEGNSKANNESSRIINSCRRLGKSFSKDNNQKNKSKENEAAYSKQTFITIKKTPPVPINEVGCRPFHDRVKLKYTYTYTFNARQFEDGIRITNLET